MEMVILQTDGEGPQEIPEGYVEVEVGDEKEGDLVWNVLSQQWESLQEAVLVTALAFGTDVFRYRPIRKK
jgi:hypothetical protein